MLIEYSGFSYGSDYANDALRGVDIEKRPWDILDIVSQYLGKTGILLDVGCGTAKKIIPLADNVRYIAGVEVVREMLLEGQEQLAKMGLENIGLSLGSKDHLPFKSEIFDMVSHMLAPYELSESIRVLKPGGRILLERTGESDKQNIVAFFDNDPTKTPRGMRREFGSGELAKAQVKAFEEAGLVGIISVEGFWHTKYSFEGILALLNNTPLIKDFNPEKDKKVIDAINDSCINGEFVTAQHRILVIAQKPL